MVQAAPIHVLIERIACDAYALSFDVQEASRTTAHSERKTAEAERIAAELHSLGDRMRRLFRG